MSQTRFVGLGHISGIYGLRGWVKVFSYTQPREQILDYRNWHIAPEHAPGEPDDEPIVVESAKRHGKGIIAKLAGVEDRDAAAALNGCGIFVERAALPELRRDEFYWADLAGLEVVDAAGRQLGHVDHLIETGAHDVLVLAEGDNRLIPFVPGKVVLDVDLERGVIAVDWDASWWE